MPVTPVEVRKAGEEARGTDVLVSTTTYSVTRGCLQSFERDSQWINGMEGLAPRVCQRDHMRSRLLLLVTSKRSQSQTLSRHPCNSLRGARGTHNGPLCVFVPRALRKLRLFARDQK